MHFRACITVGRLEMDPNNTRRKRVNFKKGRTITKWYRAPDIGVVLTLVNKTKFAKFNFIESISYADYVKGVEKQHEY